MYFANDDSRHYFVAREPVNQEPKSSTTPQNANEILVLDFFFGTSELVYSIEECWANGISLSNCVDANAEAE